MWTLPTVSALSTRTRITSPPRSGSSVSPRSTTPLQVLATPALLPWPIVMIRSVPDTLLPTIRPITGGSLMLSQFGLLGSGFLGSGHLGNLPAQRANLRSGGVGQSIVFWHTGFAGSGGVGHLPVQPGQFGGAPGPHTALQAGTLMSNENSSQPTSISGTAASLGGSGISSLSGSNDGPAV